MNINTQIVSHSFRDFQFVQGMFYTDLESRSEFSVNVTCVKFDSHISSLMFTYSIPHRSPMSSNYGRIMKYSEDSPLQ